MTNLFFCIRRCVRFRYPCNASAASCRCDVNDIDDDIDDVKYGYDEDDIVDDGSCVFSPIINVTHVPSTVYENGIVTLNPIVIESGKFKDGQSIVEISACPASNDVVGLQDLYLQLDISTSNFETIVDEISSGLDPAASNYVVTSSYSNGALVRA